MSLFAALTLILAQHESPDFGRLEWGPIVLAGAGDPVHSGAQQINYWSVGLQVGMPVYEALDFFGEFDYSHHYPTNLGHDYDLIQFFVGFRFYPFNRGFYTMIGVGQSWNSNDDDKFWIKQVQTHFNWGLHAALGYRFGLTDDMDLMIEVRFSHWSNGSFTGDRNYGLNDLLLGASVLFK